LPCVALHILLMSPVASALCQLRNRCIRLRLCTGGGHNSENFLGIISLRFILFVNFGRFYLTSVANALFIYCCHLDPSPLRLILGAFVTLPRNTAFTALHSDSMSCESKTYFKEKDSFGKISKTKEKVEE
jgi:hypothetical protein